MSHRSELSGVDKHVRAQRMILNVMLMLKDVSRSQAVT